MQHKYLMDCTKLPMSAGDERLPRSLWWVLAGLTLSWGFNWTAMKVSLGEVLPWTFRTLCLAAGP
jgi:hypothetical protein